MRNWTLFCLIVVICVLLSGLSPSHLISDKPPPTEQVVQHFVNLVLTKGLRRATADLMQFVAEAEQCYGRATAQYYLMRVIRFCMITQFAPISNPTYGECSDD